MSAVKASLKAAKAALDSKKWAEALKKSQETLELDPQNYIARLFLARAQDKLGDFQNAETTYLEASRMKQADVQVWLGIRDVYESQGSAQGFKYIEAAQKIAEKYLALDDATRCQAAITKAIDVGRNKLTKDQYKAALKLQLPNTQFYPLVGPHFPPPAHTYLRLIEITEAQETEKIDKEIQNRRTRIGAKKDQVTAEVRREVFTVSDLDEFYTGLIEWTIDDEQRREFEEKKLQRTYDYLVVAETDQKESLRESVLDMANGMVILRRSFPLAWEVILEWTDIEDIAQTDVSNFREYVSIFPNTGLAKVFNGYFATLSPTLGSTHATDGTVLDDSDSSEDGGVSLMLPEDGLLLMSDGLLEAKESSLAHRIMSHYYLQLEEYESTVETVRHGIRLCNVESKKCGRKLQKNLDAMNTTLASALIQYQTPRHHPESRLIFQEILKRKPNHTPALLGTGLILEEDENFTAASEYLSKALEKDPNNIRVGVEAAWCRALTGQTESALVDLERYLEQIPDDESNREVRAQTLYRIGRCQWDLRTSKVERKDRKGPYSKFLATIKTDINHAPAYTSLGLYYEDYAKDQRRSRQCFQKAFDLSPAEIIAAERLAKSFADQGDWAVVEVIAQRVVDSGNARPPPGSHKKGISWPYSALGVVQMSRQDYQKAIVSFLAALRISPDDYHSYVGLGESYHNSGRYNSALRTFNYAENPDDGIKMKKSKEDWFTKYMLANVSRELGSFDEALLTYRDVLSTRTQEYGVHIALLQTLLEKASRSIETGFYGRAVDCAQQAIDVALEIIKYKTDAFNLWRGVADACAVFSIVQAEAPELPLQKVLSLLEHQIGLKAYGTLADIDDLGENCLQELKSITIDDIGTKAISTAVYCAILAYKRAVECSSSDVHAQAVAWYNLGWAEYKAHINLEDRANPISDKPGRAQKFLRASVRCFKRAIELESGNSEFWNALGVATAKLSPKVSQHAFVRSLHLTERNPKAWTNLGALYLYHNDYELAHLAFSKAQSSDPDYSHAWVGEGIVALLTGHAEEALLHFTHAFEISESSTTIVKKELAKYTFDDIKRRKTTTGVQLKVLQPLLALYQLHGLESYNLPFEHVFALYQERMGNYTSAVSKLADVCEQLESSYESNESPTTLLKFAQAKADLARNNLALDDYKQAANEAETALNLTDDEDSTDPSLRHALRLSARLTVGIARFLLQDMDGALAAFRAAIQETNASPDVVCSLAEVLWARGGVDERVVAKEQLFESIGKGTGHVGPVLLLGVMASLENDKDTADAVKEELEAYRARKAVSPEDLDRVEQVLEALATFHHEGTDSNDRLYEMQKTIMRAPYRPVGWSRMADELSDAKATELSAKAADMALLMAQGNVPPRGIINAEGLADAFVRTGRVGDAQKAIMVAPFVGDGWKGLLGAVAV